MTCLQNTIDTSAMTECLQKLNHSARQKVRQSLAIDSGNVAVFTGGLYEKKRLAFLLSSAHRIRERIPDFHLIVIGDGPQRQLVEVAAEDCEWIHYQGKLDDVEKVPFWAISKLLLMPGLVGLVIIDSFALGVPLVTTDYPYHSPEFSYHVNNLNAVVSSPWESEEAYVGRVCELLMDDQALAQLKGGALDSAKSYSMENMVNRMVSGICSALDFREKT